MKKPSPSRPASWEPREKAVLCCVAQVRNVAVDVLTVCRAPLPQAAPVQPPLHFQKVPLLVPVSQASELPAGPGPEGPWLGAPQGSVEVQQLQGAVVAHEGLPERPVPHTPGSLCCCSPGAGLILLQGWQAQSKPLSASDLGAGVTWERSSWPE